MKFYQVDSFANRLFSGNPAGICIVAGDWPKKSVMQSIAAENNLSETAFIKQRDTQGQEWDIRWFAPLAEVNLCGHATLAAAHVLFSHENINAQKLAFNSNSGQLFVEKQQHGLLVLDFPKDNIRQIEWNKKLDCFNFTPKQVWCGTEEYMLIAESQSQIYNAVCDLEKAAKIDLSGFIITAEGEDGSGFDFVSRYFSPKIGINEDPVTGSTHTLLVPYWQKVLKKDEFIAYQASARGGALFCHALGERVKIGGYAVTFLQGEILL
ncbi:MAG: PhzF family phenazine biosynthesis protein [Defluviitaleaceae bacterium]|nr:PhzF family phenazine biosynthesis protein [Defluviitaleaceae bacterium]